MMEQIQPNQIDSGIHKVELRTKIIKQEYELEL